MATTIDISFSGFNAENLKRSASINTEVNRQRHIEKERLQKSTTDGIQQRRRDLIRRGQRQVPLTTNPSTNSSSSVNQNNPLYSNRPILRRREDLSAFRTGFKADYLILSYFFTTGEDLDTRTSLWIPSTNMFSSIIGWNREQNVLGIDGLPILTWSGDNTDTGYESVLIDIKNYQLTYPSATNLVLSTKAFWYDKLGESVQLFVIGYLGGTMVKIEEIFNWENTTAIRRYDKYPSFETVDVKSNESMDLEGDFIAYLFFNLTTGTIVYRDTPPGT